MYIITYLHMAFQHIFIGFKHTAGGTEAMLLPTILNNTAARSLTGYKINTKFNSLLISLTSG